MPDIMIDVTRPIEDFDGEPVPIGKQVDDQPVEVLLMRTVLLNILRAHETMDGQESIDVLELGRKIARIDEPSLNVDEFVLIKKIIAARKTQGYGLLVMGQVNQALHNKPSPEPKPATK